MTAEPLPLRWRVRQATAEAPMAIYRSTDDAEITFGTLVSFPSYNGKPHYGAVTELFQAGGDWWVTVVGPYGRHSPRATGHHRRASQAADLTILGIPHPEAGQVWTYADDRGTTHRVRILDPDGLWAVARNLGTGHVGTYLMIDYRPESSDA